MPSSADRAYDYIKTGILHGRLRGGERLPEDQVAGYLGISRTPVRDALRRLESEGLVASARNSGARVATWSEGELSEIAAMRVQLESYAAELAAAKIRPDELNVLKAECDRMQAASEGEPDFDGISRANYAFHRTIAEASRNPRLVASLEPLWFLPLAVRKFSLFSRERRARSIQHHREIVAALEGADPEWARAIMQAHLYASRAYDRLISAEPTDGGRGEGGPR